MSPIPEQPDWRAANNTPPYEHDRRKGPSTWLKAKHLPLSAISVEFPYFTHCESTILKQPGKYQIQRVLGHGAMSEVYLAHHPTTRRDVAIKTIIPSMGNGADAEERLRREATAAGTLNHPNIVTIYDFDQDGDLLYLVREYVKGEELEVIINEQPLSPFLLLEVLAQICDGLGCAHRNGVVHRDIKPANVRVTRDGERVLAKVMEFGIARLQDSNMTASGIVMGNVSYMPHEYIQHGLSSPQGDLWAVGVMLYQCLTGQRPFGGDNTTTILFQIVSAEPPLLDPVTIQGILSCALSKDPARRFKTAVEFAKSLRACQDPARESNLEGTAMLAAIPLDPDATSCWLGRSGGCRATGIRKGRCCTSHTVAS